MLLLHPRHPTPPPGKSSTWVYPADSFSLRKLRLAASFRQGSEMCKHDPSAKWRGMPAKADCPLWMDPLEMGKCSILTGLAAVDWMLPLTCMSNHVKVEIGSIENTPCQHALIVLRIELMASVQLWWDLCWTANGSDWTGSPATPRRLHHHAKTSESKANEMLTNLSWTATISIHGSSAHIKSFYTARVALGSHLFPAPMFQVCICYLLTSVPSYWPPFILDWSGWHNLCQPDQSSTAIRSILWVAWLCP